jgi:hypothetical protein
VAAAVVETPTPGSTSVAAAQGPRATATPQPTATKPAPTEVATATTEPSAPTRPVTPADLEPGQLVIQVDVTDKLYATASNPFPWVRVTTSELTFVIASSWEITNDVTNEDEIAVVGNILTIKTGNAIVTDLVLDLRDGEVTALIKGEYTPLRAEDGKLIDSAKLLELVDGDPIGPFLHHFITSIEFPD